MSLRYIIEEKYKNSIKIKNAEETNTFRLVKSAIKDKDIASRSKENKDEISNNEILSLLQNLIKQRKDSIESFKLAKREDLILIEQKEIDIISLLLPQQMNEEEVNLLIQKIIKDENLQSLKDMGKLMNILKENHIGNIDMALAGKIAKTNLKN